MSLSFDGSSLYDIKILDMCLNFNDFMPKTIIVRNNYLNFLKNIERETK